MTTPIYVFNKYYTLYHNIISIAISPNRYKSKETYYENHHIIPKSFGGSNEPDNLVLLTAREHYICHYLLTKFTISNHKRKMCFAFNMMNNDTKHIVNSKLFQSNKNKQSFLGFSEEHKRNIHTSSKGRILSDNHKQKISIALTGRKRSNKTKTKMSNSQSGLKNPGSIGYYITPWGKFESSRLSVNSTLSANSIINYCRHNNNKIISRQSISKSKYLQSLKESPLGKTFNEIGFDFDTT